jgi:hypothetical protein
VRLQAEVLAAILLTVTLHACVLLLASPDVLAGRLVDSDCYLRLMRIEILLSGGGWYDSHVPLLNAPQGLEMHWTRLFDALILLLALPLMAFLALPDALFWAGALISPVLHVVAAGLIAWAARPLLGRAGTLLAVVLFLCQASLYGVFQVGRADHHSLLLVLAILVLALLLRWSLGPRTGLSAVVSAGFAAAMGLWVGSEALMTLAVGGGALGLMWIAGERGAARGLFAFALCLLGGVLLALVIERPPQDWFVAELDRLSIVQLVLAAALAIAAWLVTLIDQRRPGAGPALRILVCGILSLIPITVMALLFPGFFAGPYGEVDDAVRQVFLVNVQEAEPMFDRGPTTLADVVFTAGPVLIALPFAVWAVFRRRRERAAWLLMIVALGVYLAASMHQVRVLAYFQTALVLPWAGAIVALGTWFWQWSRRPWRAPLTALFLIALLGWHIVAGAVLLGTAGRQTVASWQDGCDWTSLGTLLGELDPPVTGTIATMVFPGPEIAWRSGIGVVSAPYHRNTQGILDVHALFLAQPDVAEGLARDREIELIVLCEAAPGRGGHAWYRDRSGDGGLYGLLAKAMPPDWLAAESLDGPLQGGFLIYRRTDRP